MRLRLESAFERFIDLRGENDSDIAARLREMEIDIAVDLMGFTGECRSAIFAHRPAPLQVNYLGFPGTMGAPYIDYIVADATVIPEDHQRSYAEKIAYLPDCYLPSDSDAPHREAPDSPRGGPARTGVRLRVFQQQLQICGAHLRHLDAAAARHRRQRAVAAAEQCACHAQPRPRGASRGVAAERIVFAPPVPAADEHLARLSLADLFLDTLPYNAHTSASDALWAGVPLLTLLGNSFAGRAAASALNAVGLPGLIAHTPAAYEAMALSLARDPAALADLRAKLARNRDASALFDTARFTRHLEAAFETMWTRHQQGEPPASFAVARTG